MSILLFMFWKYKTPKNQNCLYFTRDQNVLVKLCQNCTPNDIDIQLSLLIREFLIFRVNFTIFCWNGLLLLFSRLIREAFQMEAINRE